MYQVLSTEHMVCCDVDDTLLMWDYRGYDMCNLVKIKDPYTEKEKTYGIHRPHILLLKQYKARGYKVTVWSKSGELHAEAAVNALGLADYVDFVMTKPEKVIDDKSDVLSIVGPVIYLKPNDVNN